MEYVNGCSSTVLIKRLKMSFTYLKKVEEYNKQISFKVARFYIKVNQLYYKIKP